MENPMSLEILRKFQMNPSTFEDEFHHGGDGSETEDDSQSNSSTSYRRSRRLYRKGKQETRLREEDNDVEENNADDGQSDNLTSPVSKNGSSKINMY